MAAGVGVGLGSWASWGNLGVAQVFHSQPLQPASCFKYLHAHLTRTLKFEPFPGVVQVLFVQLLELWLLCADRAIHTFFKYVFSTFYCFLVFLHGFLVPLTVGP